MKLWVFVVSVLSLASLAHAETVDVLAYGPILLTWEGVEVSAEFEVNPSLGRARVLVNLVDPSIADSEIDNRAVVPRFVRGLSFNRDSSQIIYADQNREVVCANVKVRKYGYQIRPTGNCPLITGKKIVSYDDGWEIKKRVLASVLMNIIE